MIAEILTLWNQSLDDFDGGPEMSTEEVTHGVVAIFYVNACQATLRKAAEATCFECRVHGLAQKNDAGIYVHLVEGDLWGCKSEAILAMMEEDDDG